MELLRALWAELVGVLVTLLKVLPYLAGYILLIVVTMLVWRWVKRLLTPKRDYGSLKTVTFGDESTVTSNLVASIVSIALIFLLWGTFTGSKLLPGFLHMPGAFTGEVSFSYLARDAAGNEDEGTVTVIVHGVEEKVSVPEVSPGDGFAKNDAAVLPVYRTKLVNVLENDEGEGLTIVAIDGKPISPGRSVGVKGGKVRLSDKGTPNFAPKKGWQMEPIWLPSPEAVWSQLTEIATGGYRNFSLAEHLGYSLFRVVLGFFLGALVGIPLGYAMGLSDWFRGWFDPIVEFMRPVPPLALIPLVIIWAGIGEDGKIVLLFLAALWIMAIAARAGVSGVAISKVHAAYSLGASKWQIMRHVIVPNSLPEIFTGARVAMGVCWGTVVAAELVAAEKGAGMMIMVASKFQDTDTVIMGIILIGIIGFGIDMLMRLAEKWLVPWKGKG